MRTHEEIATRFASGAEAEKLAFEIFLYAEERLREPLQKVAELEMRVRSLEEQIANDPHIKATQDMLTRGIGVTYVAPQDFGMSMEEMKQLRDALDEKIAGF